MYIKIYIYNVKTNVYLQLRVWVTHPTYGWIKKIKKQKKKTIDAKFQDNNSKFLKEDRYKIKWIYLNGSNSNSLD